MPRLSRNLVRDQLPFFARSSFSGEFISRAIQALIEKGSRLIVSRLWPLTMSLSIAFGIGSAVTAQFPNERREYARRFKCGKPRPASSIRLQGHHSEAQGYKHV